MKTKKLISFAVFFAILTSFLFGCNNKAKDDSSVNKSLSSNVKNEIILPCSSSLSPLVNIISEKYSSYNTDFAFKLQTFDSSTGLNELNKGTVPGTFTNIYAYDAISPELTQNFIDTKFCVQGFVFITHPDSEVTNLSQQQAINIFTGKISNWKKISDENLPITVVSNSSDSGTEIILKKYAFTGFKENRQNFKLAQNSKEIPDLISQTPGAISYIELSGVQNNNKIKKLSFDGIEPTLDNIKTGKYPIWSYGHFYTKINPSEPISKFIDYIKSDEVNSLIRNNGYIPLSDMQTSR